MSNPFPVSSHTRDRRQFLVFCIRRLVSRMDNALDSFISYCSMFAETFILLIGPLLICFASVIISGLSWVFFTIDLPMMQFDLDQKDASLLRKYVEIGGNVAFVIFILAEILFNYYMCVTTRNTGPKSSYDTVVRELAESTNLEYPTTPQEVARFRRDFNDKITIRIRRRREREAEERERQNGHSGCCDANGDCSSNPNLAKNGTAAAAKGSTSSLSAMVQDESPLTANSGAGNTATGENVTLRKNTRLQKSNNKTNNRGGGTAPSPPIRNWMLMAPDEWGYCNKTDQPKPPRSHYDHVSKSLVLCLDHYCPWMFNAIGYFNYRYFVNFLLYVFTGMMYGASISYRPFTNSTGPLYREQLVQFRKTGVWTRIHPYTPFSSERMPLSLGFMLCLAVGVAVACLGGFHLHLVFSGQTTIEFHGNFIKRRKASRSGQKYRNPYDMGWKRNWQQVYGDYSGRWSMLMAVLIPSRREPDFLPLPIGGEEGKRKHLRQRRDETEMTKPFISSQASAPATIV